MNITTLLAKINSAIQANALGLNNSISGISWKADIQAAILRNFKLKSLSITTTGLTAVRAPVNSVTDADGKDMPSALLFGTPGSDILNVPKDQIQLTVYVTPTDQTDPSTDVYFTLIAQIKPPTSGLTAWAPADSFPGLSNSSVFNTLIATEPPSLLLTAFDHNQQWSFGGPGISFSNTFKDLKTGLNLQLPCGLSTELFPPLLALFGDLSLITFIFNGQVDNSETDTDPKNLSIDLLADLGDNYNKSLGGNSNFSIEFDAGFQAIPSQTTPNPPDTDTAAVLVTQAVVQAKIGNALMQAIVPLTGQTLTFSITGLDGHLPALSLSDIAFLFEQSFLSDNLPKSITESDFFINIGVENLGMTINMPTHNGALEITSILLQIGYSKSSPPYIGYQPWFDLRSFSVTWSVLNPFPVANCQPTILLDGDFDLLEGDIAFEASFSKENASEQPKAGDTRADPGAKWVFEIQGGLIDKSNNTIKLSELFAKFSSAADDFPDIEIDALAFSAKPELSYYYGSIEIDIDWGKFKGFNAPKLNSLSLDITDNKGAITGSIATEIAIGKAIFDFKAERTEAAWDFSANSKEDFNIGDLATAFGLDTYPAYLDKIDIKQATVKYTAPVKKSGETQQPVASNIEKPADATAASTFSIVLEVSFPIAGEVLDATISYAVDANRWNFDGILLIGPANAPDKQLEFEFKADGKKIADGQNPNPGTETTLVATLSNPTGKDFGINDFAAAFGSTIPSLPAALNAIKLSSASVEYDTGPNGKGFLFTAVSVEYGQLVFAILKTGTDESATWKPFFALAFTPTLDFTKLPVVGSFIPKIVDIEQIQIAAIPKALSAADITELTTLFTNAKVPTTLIPQVSDGNGLPAEAIFNAVLNLNDEKKPINLVFKSTAATPTGNTALPAKAPADQAAEGSDIPANNSQQSVGKSFGPVHISKFNLAYSDGKLALAISGELTLAGMALSFQGMGIKMKFPPKSVTDVSFELHGLGLNINKGSLRIAGGFITLDDNYDNFMGMLAVTAGPIGMQAFGGYATTTPQPSFFIFVHVNVPIGGPPFFFIDGVSGGFGLNRSFKLPDIEELPTFPLLPAAANNPLPTAAPSSLDDVTQALTQLAKYIPPKQGAYWIAAGLDFTSFELIQVSAILELSFGTGFQLGLIASAALSIPEPEEPIAYIQLVFEVDFDTEEGVLAIFAVITPASYVFSGACHLTGGFAFFTWYKGEHEGDFLVSIGGYHPAFVKPAWYPSVPRLGMNWDLGPLKITGQAYFALTPHILMAGLEMSAVFDIKIVKATFDAGFDFLLGWKPFFYLADAYIHISIELHLVFTFHFHVGVDLDIWGPEFGGKARIDLSIFSFTIHFGSSAPTPPPIAWSEFKKMLPNSHPQKDSAPMRAEAHFAAGFIAAEPTASAPFSTSQVMLSKGLLQQMEVNPMTESDITTESKLNWLIDPNAFQFLVSAGVPCNNFYFNNDLSNGQNAINARDSKWGLTPASGHGNYLKPDDLEKFYTNPNNNPSEEALFAYDYPDDEADFWWKQPVQVGPVDIEEGAFDGNGNRTSGFASIFVLNVYALKPGTGQIGKELTNNFVITLVSKNAAKSLWGGIVKAATGSTQLNDAPTVKYTLFGAIISPKLWNPLKTTEINIYELLYQDGNNLCWPAENAPSVPANSFDETIADDTMTFNLSPGNQVQSKFRTLDPEAFINIETGKNLIQAAIADFGFEHTLAVNTNQEALAAPMYKDWPVLALLGEEGPTAANPT